MSRMWKRFDPRPVPCFAAVVLAVSALAAVPVLRADEPAIPLAEGDAAWLVRAEGSSGGTALTGPVDKALAAYRKAIAQSPGALEPRWKAMRALYFKGEYTTKDAEEQKRLFDEGKKLGEEAFELVRKTAAGKAGKDLAKATPVEIVPYVKGDQDVAATFLWAAVDWGKWALVFGKSAAIKQGAAAKIRDYSAAVIAMDPAFEDAGGYRVLGRLHHQTPSVPFFTGWASRKEALKNLQEACTRAPKNFINRLYLAEAQWDYESSKRPDARAALGKLIAETPAPEWLVEDRKAQEDAKALLATWKKD